MMKNARGFTLVELLVVIVVIVILATIATFTYTGYQSQAQENAMDSTARLIASFQTKYQESNGEYLSAREMAGGSGIDGRTMTAAQYQTLSQQLNIGVDALTNNRFKFTPTVGFAGVFSPTESNRVYMLSKDTTNQSSYTFPIGNTGCEVTFPVENSDASRGSTAYSITYYSEAKKRWVIYASGQGNVTIASTGSPAQNCVFDSKL